MIKDIERDQVNQINKDNTTIPNEQDHSANDGKASNLKEILNIMVDSQEPVSNQSIPPEIKLFQGENNMAEVDTVMLTKDHADILKQLLMGESDIRKETVDGTNQVVRELLKAHCVTDSKVAENGYQTRTAVDTVGDKLSAQHFTIGRDTADLRAQVIQAISEIKMAGEKTSKETEIAVLKNTIEGQKNTQMLSDKITTDGEKTRELVNSLRNSDLERLLVERNAELVGCGCRTRSCGGNDNFNSQIATQLAVLQNQVQAFGSQLQETRQGMVNFGTMAGVGQSSTTNAVR